MNQETPRHGAGLCTRSSLIRAFAAFAVAATFHPVALLAQTAPAPTKKEDVVEMATFVATGTRFNDRTVTQSPVPIDVVSRSDLRSGGYTETNQMLQALIPSYNFPRASVADGTDHIRPATLRGLAPDQTLVLLNGKRRHTSALVNVNGTVGRGAVSVDLNTIPASMIERIEVLRDGASAQYGSDAIAGVINVILRKDQGYGFDGTYGVTKEDDGAVKDASAWAGVPLGDNGSLFVNVFYRDREQTNRSNPDTRQQYFGTSTTTGLPTAINANFGSGFTPTANNGATVAAAPSTAFTLDPREATINRRNHRQGDGDSEDYGFMFNADLPLASGSTFYAFGGYNSREGQAAGFFRRPGDDRTVRAIYPNGFLPLINSDITDFSIGGGLKGKGSAVDWDLSSVFGSNDFGFTISNSANVTLGAASKTTFNAGELGFRQWTNNLEFTTSWDVGGQPVKAAYGAEFRWENYEIIAGEPDSYRDGGVRIIDGPATGGLGAVGAQVFPGFRPSDAIDTDRTSYAAYIDLATSFNETVDLTFASRFENFSDFGSTFDVKLAGRVKAGSALAFRGSASTGFRAPHLAQQWFSSTATNFIGGIPFENKTFPVSDPVARLLGASSLKAEESVNLSVGITYQPNERFTASVDFYNIDIDDRVVLSSNFSGGPIGPFLVANGQAQANGGRYFTNAVDTTTKGVDLNFNYAWTTENMGKFTVTGGANFNDTKITRFSATPPQLAALGVVTPLFDIVERTRMEEGAPKNVLNLGVNWDVNNFTFHLRNIRYGEVSAAQSGDTGWIPARNAALNGGFNVRLADPSPGAAAGNLVPIQTFDAKWITDLGVTYRFSKNCSISAGANNLFDVYPTKNIASNTAFLGSDNAGIFPYSGISPWGFNGAFYYTKASYKF